MLIKLKMEKNKTIVLGMLITYISSGKNFAYTLQYLQNVNYFTKIRGIIQNAYDLHLQNTLLQKAQMVTDAPKGKTMH